MKRRSFLAATGTSLTVLSAGCSSVIPLIQQGNHEFGIYNGSRESHSIRVRIGNDLEGYFQDETFEMGGETANENVPVEEPPSSISLTIDSSDEHMFPWPASTNNPGTIARKADIWYEPTLEPEILIREG